MTWTNLCLGHDPNKAEATKGNGCARRRCHTLRRFDCRIGDSFGFEHHHAGSTGVVQSARPCTTHEPFHRFHTGHRSSRAAGSHSLSELSVAAIDELMANDMGGRLRTSSLLGSITPCRFEDCRAVTMTVPPSVAMRYMPETPMGLPDSGIASADCRICSEPSERYRSGW